MWYEYLYSRAYHPKAIDKDKPSKFFIQMVDNALKTMWAFDETGGDLAEMQVRRVNRYLIWYWQRLRLEDKRCKTLAEVANVLAQMPVLELKGLYTKVEGSRVFYQLDRIDRQANLIPELGILWKNTIRRVGNMDFFNIPKLINAFKKRQHQDILKLLKAAYSSIQ